MALCSFNQLAQSISFGAVRATLRASRRTMTTFTEGQDCTAGATTGLSGIVFPRS